MHMIINRTLVFTTTRLLDDENVFKKNYVHNSSTDLKGLNRSMVEMPTLFSKDPVRMKPIMSVL